MKGILEIELLISYKCSAKYDKKEKIWETKVIHGDFEKTIYGKTLASLTEHMMDHYEPEGQCSCFYKNVNGDDMEITRKETKKVIEFSEKNAICAECDKKCKIEKCECE